MKSMIFHLSVLSRSLILATVLGFSLSLVSAPSLISLLPSLPRNTPLSPSSILTIPTIRIFLNPMVRATIYSNRKHPRQTLSSQALTPANRERRWVVRSASREVSSGDAPLLIHLCLASPPPSALLLVPGKPLRLTLLPILLRFATILLIIFVQ